MKGFKLGRVFRTAVLAWLMAVSALTGCRKAGPDTQLVPDSLHVDVNIGYGELSAWPGRQDRHLANSWNRVRYQAWLSKLDGAKGLSLLYRANRVNDLVNNTVTYASDKRVYGKEEYFASGVETVLKGYGDCEDFAIAKLYALKYLGVPESRMCVLAVAHDTAVSKKTDHAVLAVDTSAVNNWTNCLILDNAINSLETLGQDGYMPRIMINTGEIRPCTLKVLKPPAP